MYNVCPSVCVDSPALCDLNESFLTMARERDYKVLSFAETMPTTVGPMIKLVVVPPQSAGEWRVKVGGHLLQWPFLLYLVKCSGWIGICTFDGNPDLGSRSLRL